jgi:hypothetical protein
MRSGAQQFDCPGQIDAERHRQLVLRHERRSGTDDIVDWIDARGKDPNDHLVIPWLGQRDVVEAQDLGSAEAMDANCLHGRHGGLPVSPAAGSRKGKRPTSGMVVVQQERHQRRWCRPALASLGPRLRLLDRILYPIRLLPMSALP